MIKHRVTVPIQSKGNVGKSTEAIARLGWMSARGLSWRAFDLDSDNRTLSKAVPGVQVVELSEEPETDLIRLFRTVPESSLTLIDPRAHLSRILLRSLEAVRFFQYAGKEPDTRVTILFYPMDDLSVMDEIAEVVERVGNQADYVVVRNRARIPRIRMYEGSELEKELLSLGATTLEVPALLSDTRDALAALEIGLQRGISPVQALVDPEVKLDLIHRIILEDWLRLLFGRYERAAALLLAGEEAEKIARAAMTAADAEREPPRIRRGGKVNLQNLL
ncbi:Predicted ATPase [Methylacidimicrobium sp. AP8]|uniref:ATPase n=1 Tax=Methylacidimicrobium sp. AP8 TaxID=2730359 RepID=UPI0018C199C2|nr:ATPase [Methylacidimicrobium sp. AP8]CAB4242550.1 Predicted ATPase [Methylacidimicrobium sp. AP8]